MDWTQLAQGVAMALAPFLPYLVKGGEKAIEAVGEKVGEAGWDKAHKLYEVVQGKLSGDADAERALTQVAVKPESEPRRAVLAEVIEEKVQEDTAFGQQLQQVLNNIQADSQTVSFLTQVYGGEVGKIVNIKSDVVHELNV